MTTQHNEIGHIITIKSRVEPQDNENNISDIEKFVKKEISTGYIVVWLNYAIFIGKIEDREFIFHNGLIPDLSHLLQLRVFNKEKEIFIWRSSLAYKYRIRVDNDGEDTVVIDAEQVLWGTHSRNLGGDFSEIYEDRGIKLIIPFKDLNLNPDKRLILKTRNYIRHNEIGQAGFVDSRFVDFYLNKTAL